MSSAAQPLLTVIIPHYNERSFIKVLLEKVQAVPIPKEIILVDDGSEPDVIAVLKNEIEGKFEGLRVFYHEKNQGKGAAIRTGLIQAKGDIIIIQDADKEYDPNEIPKLLQPILEGKADIVYGSRFLGAKRPAGMAFANWIANRFLTWITNLLYGLNLTDMETCYKVFRAEIIKNLKLRANRFTFEPEVTALLAKNKIKILELPISYHGRTAEEGKKIKARDFFFAIFILLRHLF